MASSSSLISSILGMKRKHLTEPENVSSNYYSHACNRTLTRSSLVDSCFNYLNSQVPTRVMYYNHGAWLDFPHSITQILINGFKNEKSSIKFSMGDDVPLLFDYLSMVVINLRTKTTRSVAWIDEAKKCYFPKVFGFDDDENSNEWDFENSGNDTIQNLSPKEEIKHVVREIVTPGPRKPHGASDKLRMKLEILERGSESFTCVQHRFLLGMGPFANPGNIMYIHKYVAKDGIEKEKKESFERLVNTIKEERGNAYVRYAWFGAKKVDIVGTLIHGFGNYAKPTEGVYGNGLYLIPEDRSFAGVNLCDVDEKGMQYMILCRVILDSIEQVHPGTNKYHPSTGNYSSAADDISSSKCYVVWPSDISTCIHPEYLVSFKLASIFQEYLFGLNDIRFSQELTKVVPNSSSPQQVIQEPVKGPTSPWLPFPVLFEQFSEHVSPLAMELLLLHHHELKRRIITREELVSKVRLIIGDQLLISTLTKFKCDPSFWYDGSPAKKRNLNE